MTLWSIIGAILVLALCVFLHELGHFLSALALGVPVDEFSIGFGPKLAQLKFRGIKYSIRPILLGGYVRYCMDESDIDRYSGVKRDSDETETADAAANERSYFAQPAWKRFISALCGPVMNFVLAFVAAVALYSMLGNPVAVPRVTSYTTDSAAYAAGINAGDIIVGLNGEDVSYDPAGTLMVQNAIASSEGKPIVFEVERGGERVELSITPVYSESSGQYMIGVTFGSAYSPCSFGEAFSRAGNYLVYMTGEMYRGLSGIFTSDKPIDQQLTGPVGTVQMISEQVQLGRENAFNIIMLISLNFGILNLLPIPGLDGSKLVFLAIEMIRRKPIPPNREAIVNFMGLALLFGLMLFVTYKDVVRLITG